jgi:hypothetical protein
MPARFRIGKEKPMFTALREAESGILTTRLPRGRRDVALRLAKGARDFVSKEGTASEEK